MSNYKESVTHTLISIANFAKTVYNTNAYMKDSEMYYNTVIKKEGILSEEEFWELARRVATLSRVEFTR